MVLELQQRANEYSQLMTNRWDNLRGELVGSMPVIDEAVLRKKRGQYEIGAETPTPSSPTRSATSGMAAMSFGVTSPVIGGGSSASMGGGGGSSLLDLDDIFGGGVAKAPTPALAPTAAPAALGNDLLADIFAARPPGPPAQPPAPAPAAPFMNMGMGMGMGMGGGFPPAAPAPAPNLMMGGMGGFPAGPMSPSAAPASPFGAAPMMGLSPAMSPNPTSGNAGNVIKAFDKNGFQVFMELSKPNPATPNVSRVVVKFNNLTPYNMDNLMFQAAVPKYLRLDMSPASSTTVAANTQGVTSQEVRVTNSNHGEKPIMLKLKLGYTQNGATVSYDLEL
jgi:AP-1 complex subunit gamma-1